MAREIALNISFKQACQFKHGIAISVRQKTFRIRKLLSKKYRTSDDIKEIRFLEREIQEEEGSMDELEAIIVAHKY